MNAATEDMRVLDPASLAVLASRFDSIVREMTNTLSRSGHSTILAVARDLSCSIVTAESELLSAIEGITTHVFGSHLQAASVKRLHDDMAEGDAYLDNDPYDANTHIADYAILVPVYWQGEHVFTTVSRAHQADCGNSIPSTYHPLAKDVYEEGGLIFPSVRIQRDYEDVGDVIRMCRRRIRVPDQWYGDYLAMLGAARIGERRIKEALEKHGLEEVKAFVRQWLDYSEERARHTISLLPRSSTTVSNRHDAFEGLPDGVPMQATLTVDPDEGLIEVDLRDNGGPIPGGLNQSRATAMNNAITGVFNVLGPDVPVNSGAFRRIDVLIKDNSAIGAAIHPISCSVSTTNVADRIINMIGAGFADVAEGKGVAEGGVGMGPAFGVIAGVDPRIGGDYINSLILGSNGGPATSGEDGWITYMTPCGAGVTYRDSVEVIEQQYPMLVHSVRLKADSGGPGQWRGAPGLVTEYGTRFGPMSVGYMLDGYDRPARGTQGGGSGSGTIAYVVDEDGTETVAERMGQIEITPGMRLRTENGGGGGYGEPYRRDAALVLADVRARLVSPAAAREHYGVVIDVQQHGDVTNFEIDIPATTALRGSRA